MACINSGTLPGGRLHLFGLPQELQDIIFDYAFQRDSDTRIVPSSEYRPIQGPLQYVQTICGSKLGTDKFVHRRKVDDFMLSKQFLVAAARAYVGSQPVVFEDGVNPWNAGLLIALARCATSDLFMWTAEQAPCLRSLRATTDPSDLQIWKASDEAQLPLLTQRLKAEDFERVRVVEKLDSIRGLNDFELGPGSRMHECRSEEEAAIWLANLKTFEAVLRAKVTRPRIDDSAEWPRLYAGGRVHWQSYDEWFEAKCAREEAEAGTKRESEQELKARKPRLTYAESLAKFREDMDRRFKEKHGQSWEEMWAEIRVAIKKEKDQAVSAARQNSTAHPEAPETKAAQEEKTFWEKGEAADSGAQHARDAGESTAMATRIQELQASLAAAKAEIVRLKAAAHGSKATDPLQRACKMLMIVFLLWVAWWLIEFYAEMKAEGQIWHWTNAGMQIPASRYCKMMVR